MELSDGVEHPTCQLTGQELQFLNHPNDMMLPIMQQKIGEKVGQAVLNNTLKDVFSDGRSDVALDLVNKFALEEGKTMWELKFNKKRCREIGKRILEVQRKGDVSFAPELQVWYDQTVESSLREIYAEMMRMAILHPEDVGFNADILEGCEDILSAIQGRKVAIENVRDAVLTKDLKIFEKNAKEQELLGFEIQGPVQNVGVNLSVKPEDVKAKQAYDDFKKRDEEFSAFIHAGELPYGVDLDSPVGQLAKTFAFIRSEIEKKYSLENAITHLDKTFDPEMHIWEINAVEYGLDNTYTRQLVDKLKNGQDVDLAELKKRSEALAVFWMSPAFGT